ncbi:RNA pseudouridine synthase [Trichuris suis]|nr:RNA pseudouridine synthase [Trichuris suis]
MVRLNEGDMSKDPAIPHDPRKSGPSAFHVVQGIRKKLEQETIEEIKKNDADGSLVALYKIHSLIPDLIKMPREEIVDLCANSVVYNKDDVVVLNKPYGLSVTEGPAQFISLKSILPALRKLLVPKSKTLIPVHRLDRCTTGLLMLAASEFRLSELKDMFARREVTKKYLCLTKMVPEPPSGTIKVPIGEKKIGGNFKMVPLLITNGEKKGKYRGCIGEARLVETTYEVIKEGTKCAHIGLFEPLMAFEGSNSDESSMSNLARAKHQIRTHLGLSLGTPVIGDHKYSNYLGVQPQRLPGEVLDKLGIRASKARHLPMYLHASEIQIPDFIRGHDFHLKADIPRFFAYTIKRLHLRPL